MLVGRDLETSTGKYERGDLQIEYIGDFFNI